MTTTQLAFPPPDDPYEGISAYWCEKAADFHELNPHVYRLLVHYARVARDRGRNRVGIELLWNRMRWDLMLETESNDEYKLNQNLKAWYARRIMLHEPDLKGIFELRTRLSIVPEEGEET